MIGWVPKNMQHQEGDISCCECQYPSRCVGFMQNCRGGRAELMIRTFWRTLRQLTIATTLTKIHLKKKKTSKIDEI